MLTSVSSNLQEKCHLWAQYTLLKLLVHFDLGQKYAIIRKEANEYKLFYYTTLHFYKYRVLSNNLD